MNFKKIADTSFKERSWGVIINDRIMDFIYIVSKGISTILLKGVLIFFFGVGLNRAFPEIWKNDILKELGKI